MIPKANLVLNQNRRLFKNNMRKFAQLKEHIKEDTSVDELITTVTKLCEQKYSSTNPEAFKMDIFTLSSFLVTLPLKRGDRLYRVTSFPRSKDISYQSYFSIRSAENTKNNGRLHLKHKPVLYLSTDDKLAIKEANTSKADCVYLAKYEVTEVINLISIFVQSNPFTKQQLTNSEVFKKRRKTDPEWNLRTETIRGMVEKTFFLKDLKNNAKMYKLTNAIAQAFFRLNFASADGEKNYDGWVYESAEFKSITSIVNIALLPEAVKKIKLLSVSRLQGEETDKIFYPCENGRLK